MKLRRHIILLALLACPILGKAQERVGIGLEWGTGLQMLNYSSESFRTDAGYRTDHSIWLLNAHINGFAGIALEWDVTRHQTLSLTAAKRGVGSGDRIYPVGLRYARFTNGHSTDTGWWFVEAGVGYNRDAQERIAADALAGYGWRYRLGAHSFVDGGFRVAAVSYRPDLRDPDTGGVVPAAQVYRDGRLDFFLEFFLAIRLR